MNARPAAGPSIKRVAASCYIIPTETPEADGTLTWENTTLVLVEIEAGNHIGLGYTYADVSTGKLINSLLASLIIGKDSFGIAEIHALLRSQLRNLGGPGISSMAMAAVDNALWDLKGKTLQLSLLNLLGAARSSARVYGSGGFTSYSIEQLQRQLGGWAAEGMSAVKMKIGREPSRDVERVAAARAAIGPQTELFVDANGAYSPKEALAQAEKFKEYKVTWFEEPVSSDDLGGLRLIRNQAPAGMKIAAGEYGYDSLYFRNMLSAGAVDVLQADATRCQGITGFLQAGILCEAFQIPFSFHCAPSIHASAACASPSYWIGEYFFDHSRIEQMLFEGALQPVKGSLLPDRSRPGLGLEFKRADAQRYSV